MLTVFLKFLLFIWNHLMMNLGEPAISVANRVDCRICSLDLPTSSPVKGLIDGRLWFERHMNFRLCTVNFQFSLHPGLCEHSPVEWWQVDFRSSKTVPLFGAFWHMKRTCFDAGTV